VLALCALALGCQPDSVTSKLQMGGASGVLPDTGPVGTSGAAQGGGGGEGGGSPAAAPCVPSAEDEPDDRFEDSNCDGIDGDVGRAVFVAPAGDDSGRGTREDPLATLTAALIVARAQHDDVYVCNGSYQEAVVIRDQGVRIFGGYDCLAEWKRVTDRARFTSKRAVPLVIEGGSGVTIERIAFVAPDAAETEGSSIAAIIQESTGVELRRVQLESGAAGAGQPGRAGTRLLGSAPKGENGSAACLELGCSAYGQGGEAKAAPACEGGGTAEPGGFGGDGAHAGIAAQPGWASESGAVGGKVSSTLAERDGQAGGAGATGALGAASPRALGTFSGSTYLPTNAGAPGSYGKPGGGGGGGAGAPEHYRGDLCCVPGHGASQGGFGGCGGRPGQGGRGGGASIALLVIESDVSLIWTRLLSGDGGKGGTGGLGGAPQAGGAAGDVSLLVGIQRVAGVGGPGGPGGFGGSGGPGGGGPSLALALVDAPLPRMDGVQVLLGLPGFGGDAAPDATSSSDAPDGVSAPGYDFSADSSLYF